MSTTGDLAVSSIIAVGKLACVTVIGVTAAIFPRGQPVLHKSFLSDLSKMLVNVVWPAWAYYSVSSGIKRDDLIALSPLLPWCALAVSISLVLGWFSAWLCSIDSELRPAYIVACGFCNSVGIPIMLLNALCDQPVLSDIENCKNLANGCVMLYAIVWNIFFFTLALPMLEGACPSQTDASGVQITIPAVTEVSIRSPASEKDEEIVEDAFDTKVTEPEESVIQPKHAHVSRCRQALQRVWRTLTMPPMIASFLGLFTVLVPQIQDSLFESSGALYFAGSALETVSDPAVACFTFVMAASLVPSDRLRHKFSATAWPMSPKALVALLVTRLIVIPAIFYSVWYGVEKKLFEEVIGRSSRTPMIASLLALVESAAPSANMPCVFLAKMNKHDLATRLAFGYMFMYPFAILTLSVFSTIALDFVID